MITLFSKKEVVQPIVEGEESGVSQKRDKGDGIRHECDSCLDGEKSSGGYHP